MKTVFVHPNGATASWVEGDLRNPGHMPRETYLKVLLARYGNLVALITPETTWVAAAQEDLDNFIDQHIDRYMQEHGLVSKSAEHQLVVSTFECILEAVRRVTAGGPSTSSPAL